MYCYIWFNRNAPESNNVHHAHDLLPNQHSIKLTFNNYKNIMIRIPPVYQNDPVTFISDILDTQIFQSSPAARVVIVTDRDELDKQIESVFTDAGEPIKRTNSGRDLMNQLGQANPRLLCSLVHKFGRKGVDDFEGFIRELEAQPAQTQGELFVFVDECHRTQGGKLHRTMKALMPNAVFIGFTGTPLLKKDKATDYAWRYFFSYGGELRRLIDYIEDIEGAETLSVGQALELIKDRLSLEGVATDQMRGQHFGLPQRHGRGPPESDVFTP